MMPTRRPNCQSLKRKESVEAAIISQATGMRDEGLLNNAHSIPGVEAEAQGEVRCERSEAIVMKKERNSDDIAGAMEEFQLERGVHCAVPVIQLNMEIRRTHSPA